MKCTNCSFLDSKVIDSRVTQDWASIRRRRECLKCSFRFTTYEYILKTPIMVVKKTGAREEFNRKKFDVIISTKKIHNERYGAIKVKNSIVQEFKKWNSWS